MCALVSGFFPATCVLSETGSPLAHLHREEILCGSATSGFSVQVGREERRRKRGGREEEGRELTPRPSMFQLQILCGSAMSGFSVQVGREEERRRKGGGNSLQGPACFNFINSSLCSARTPICMCYKEREGVRMKGEGVCVTVEK